MPRTTLCSLWFDLQGTTGTPFGSKPSCDKPICEKPPVANSICQKPICEKPHVDKAICEEPICEKPIVMKSTVEKPICDPKDAYKFDMYLNFNNKVFVPNKKQKVFREEPAVPEPEYLTLGMNAFDDSF